MDPGLWSSKSNYLSLQVPRNSRMFVWTLTFLFCFVFSVILILHGRIPKLLLFYFSLGRITFTCVRARVHAYYFVLFLNCYRLRPISHTSTRNMTKIKLLNIFKTEDSFQKNCLWKKDFILDVKVMESLVYRTETRD